MMKEGNPAFAALEPGRLWDKDGPFVCAFQNAREHRFLFTRGNDQGDARAHDDLRRLKLGSHSADGGNAFSASGYFFNLFPDLFYFRNGFGIWLAEILNHAIHSGKDDQEVGGQEGSDQRGELVIIA